MCSYFRFRFEAVMLAVNDYIDHKQICLEVENYAF